MFTNRALAFMCLFLLSGFLLAASTCKGDLREDDKRRFSYEKKDGISTLCVFNKEDNKCWVDKSEWMGWSFKQMDGFYCLSQPDLELIILDLFRCKNK